MLKNHEKELMISINLFLDMDSISVDEIAVIVRDVITCI